VVSCDQGILVEVSAGVNWTEMRTAGLLLSKGLLRRLDFWGERHMSEVLTAQSGLAAGVFELTGEQKWSIELMPKHNLQIIARAGSGKTEIVSTGISEIMKGGVKPSKIVAFSFTDNAAEELKGRVRLIPGQDGKGAGAGDKQG